MYVLTRLEFVDGVRAIEDGDTDIDATAGQRFLHLGAVVVGVQEAERKHVAPAVAYARLPVL